MAGIGKYKKGKAFQLKSGNKPTFKMMGSSPFKTHDGTKSTTTHFADGTPKSERDKFNDAETQREISKVDPDAPGTPGKPGYEPPVKRSDLDEFGKAIWDKHRAMKKKKTGSGGDGTEGQDQNKIFDDKGKHIGNWKGDKKVLFKQKKWKKMSDLTPAEMKAMKLDKPMGKKSPAKQGVNPPMTTADLKKMLQDRKKEIPKRGKGADAPDKIKMREKTETPKRGKGISISKHPHSKTKSPAKAMPSYIGGVQVADIDADIQERKNLEGTEFDEGGNLIVDPKTAVTRKGKSLETHEIKNLTPKQKTHYEKTGKLPTTVRETIESGSATRDEELKQIELNKAASKSKSKKNK